MQFLQRLLIVSTSGAFYNAVFTMQFYNSQLPPLRWLFAMQCFFTILSCLNFDGFLQCKFTTQFQDQLLSLPKAGSAHPCLNAALPNIDLVDAHIEKNLDF
jgi:hypothetical protein